MLAKEIGPGPSLYLITLKKLSCFFFFVSILYIPVYLFLWFSDDTIPGTFGDVLGKMTLGSVGKSSTTCNFMNYAKVTSIVIQCPNKLGKLQELQSLQIISCGAWWETRHA